MDNHSIINTSHACIATHIAHSTSHTHAPPPASHPRNIDAHSHGFKTHHVHLPHASTPTPSSSTNITPSHTDMIIDSDTHPLPPSLTRPAVGDARARWTELLQRMQTTCYMPMDDIELVRSYITHGVNITDWHPHPPPPSALRNSKSVIEHHTEVRARLIDYERIGAVRRLPPSAPPPTHVQPLHVILKEGKKPRVVIDLSRNMNDFIPHTPFRYQCVASAVAASHQGCWYTKLDLSDFLSFPLHPDILHLFTFEFDSVYWQFTSMAFGLSSAPRICTQLLSVLGFALHEVGITHVRYLDDILLISRSRVEAHAHLRQACTIIASLGLVVNATKTVMPTQVCAFLGVDIDSVRCILACTPERVAELLSLGDDFAGRKSASKKDILSLIGKLSFASQVLVGARPFLRSLIDTVYNTYKNTFHPLLPLTPEFHDDLRYWCRVMTTWNGTAKWRDTPNPFVISTDASFDGFGIYVEGVPPDLVQSHPTLLHSGICGRWHIDFDSPDIDIGIREFFAILYAAHIYAPLLRDRSLHIYCDNQSDVAIITRQSTRSSGILRLLRALYSLSAEYNFNIRAFHRPGVQNVVADYLSRPDKHRYDFTPRPSQPVLLSHVLSLSSERLQLTPLHSALASNSLRLSHLSPRSHYDSTPDSAIPHTNNDFSDFVPSYNMTRSRL